jgi:hypothetical protein
MSRKGKRKSGSTRSARKKATAAPTSRPAERVYGFRVRIELTALELACGNDGLLRGMPEPVVLLGAFLLTDGQARPLGRTLVRLSQPSGRFPTVVTPPATTPSPAVLTARGRGTETTRIAVLAIAIEEDAGKDVERIYAHLGGAAGLRVWTLDDAIPSPMTLAELGPPSLPPASLRVGVVDEGADLRDACDEDDFVGASLFVITTTRQEDGFRLQFVSEDRKNDWTAIVGVRVD